MAPSIPGLESVNWMGIVSSVISWLGYILIIIIIIGVILGGYYFLSFKYKLTEFPVIGSGSENGLAIGKPIKNRLKKVNEGNSWKTLFPLFNKQEHEPFASSLIYAGKNIFAYRLGNDLIPAQINVLPDGGQMNISPVPHYIRNWQSMMHKKNAAEFAKHSFWEDNKYFFMVIITAAICLAIVGFTVYYTYQFATGGASQIGALTKAIEGMSTIASK